MSPGNETLRQDLSGDGFPNELGDFGKIPAGSPDLTEEVSRVNFSVIGKEFSVTATSKHQVGIEFASQFGIGLGKDPGEVGDAIEGLSECGNVAPGNPAVAGDPFLDGEEVVTADRGHEQGRRLRGLAFVTQVLDEVEELPWLVSDAGQETEVAFREVTHEIEVAALIAGKAASEKIEKLVIPGHGHTIARTVSLSMRGTGRWEEKIEATFSTMVFWIR